MGTAGGTLLEPLVLCCSQKGASVAMTLIPSILPATRVGIAGAAIIFLHIMQTLLDSTLTAAYAKRRAALCSPSGEGEASNPQGEGSIPQGDKGD